MYDDLLGPRKKTLKERVAKARFNLADDNAKPADKPADPDKYPSHESARNTGGSISSCSDSGVQSGCGGDCGKCDDECDAPTPKDPWSDVTPGPDPKVDDDEGLQDLGWDDDPCDADCDNCDDEDCKNIDDLFSDFFEDDDEDTEGSWTK